MEQPVAWPADTETYELEDYRLGGPAADTPASWSFAGRARTRGRLANQLTKMPLERTRALLKNNHFDLVLIDAELHPHIIATLGAGHRVALYSDWFIGAPGLRCPPLNCMTVPSDRIDAAAAKVMRDWVSLWARTQTRDLRDLLTTGGCRYIDILRHLARREGVSIGPLTTRWRWQRPFEWINVPTIILQAQEMDFPRPRSRHLMYTGPIVAQPEQEADHPALALAQSARSAGKRVIYVGFGSILKPKLKLIAALWAAIGKQEDWLAIHSLGGVEQPNLPAPPSNVHVFHWVPQRKVLDCANLAVNHGGIGTILECIDACAPMLCLPHIFDQPGCGARVVHHGLGLSLPQDACEASIGRALSQLAHQPSFRRKCAQMKDCFADYTRKRVPEATIDTILATRS